MIYIFSNGITPEQIDELINNPIFILGMIAGSVTIITLLWGKISNIFGKFFERYFITEVEIDNRNIMFLHVDEILKSQNISNKLRRVSISSPDRKKIETTIKNSSHFYKFIGFRLVRVSRTFDDKLRITDFNGKSNPLDTYSFRIYGFRNNKDVIINVLKEVKEKFDKQNKNTRWLYMPSSSGDYFITASKLTHKNMNTIFSENDNIEKAFTDVQKFMSSEKWYNDRNIPWNKGYLLYGKPGTGKTSFIKALATHLDMDIYYIHLSAKSLNDEKLMSLLTSEITSDNCIVVMEDVDAALSTSKRVTNTLDESVMEKNPSLILDSSEDEKNDNFGVTLSGILNAIDGIATAHGRILIMTTNHPEKLDPALIRPGRIDYKLELNELGRKSITKMYNNFYPSSKIEENVLDEEIMMLPCDIQSIFLENMYDAPNALNRLKESA